MSLESDFSPEQKRYLEGFASGAQALRRLRGLSTFADLAGSAPRPAAAVNGGEVAASFPDADHLAAQERVLESGRTLSAEEKAKREKHPFDIWEEMARNARDGRFPSGLDVFRYKFHGLFYVAPAQDAFMCRLRLPGGILSSAQARGVAEVAQKRGGGYVDVTSRANLQIREIAATEALRVLEDLRDLGIDNRGAGADNLRNITGSPAAGIDPQEIIDTRPLCRELHHRVLSCRGLHGLPRKLNIAFDGGGRVSVLEETNDIGFMARRVPQGSGVPAGVYFRLGLGGITGHGSLAADAGVVIEAGECAGTAVALLRVFIDHGDRSDRRRARFKYLLESWGIERLLAETERRLGRPLRRLPPAACEPRGPIDRWGHIGLHPQRQPGKLYLGVVLPAGRVRSEQLRGLAELAERYGSGVLRLTVWQNLLISDVGEGAAEALIREVEALGLGTRANAVRAGLVACTGSSGCRYALADTKRDAMRLATALEGRIALDRPINIHFTGCPHSCAQHAIGDIGLLASRVEACGELVDGYHVWLGGGFGLEQGLAREFFRDVPADEIPKLLESIIRCYHEHRRPEEGFREFVARHEEAPLRALLVAAATSVADGRGGEGGGCLP
jgi:ferredoxin-nitrite reductase